MEFIGRGDQLALLDEAVQQAHTGEPQFIVIGGAAGVGKTHLLAHFADRLAETGVRVLRGAGIELGAEGLPLAPVRSVLRDLLRQLGADALAELLPRPADLSPLLPELGDAAADPPAPTDPGGQARLFDAISTLLERLGQEQATLLVLDDLHWADRSTRDLLGYLARGLRGARVIVVAAYRAEALDHRHPLVTFLAELDRLPSVRRVELPPFGRAETAELVGHVTPDRLSDHLVEDVFRRSRGNALAVRELASANTLPDSLTELMRYRLRQLDRPARGLVQLAAVSGRSITHALLAAAAGLDEDDLLDGLRVAVDARMLVPVGESYEFPHALLRETVRDDLLPAQRTRHHRTFADALEADLSLVPAERHAAELAHHWYGAGEPDRALPALLTAADAAGRVYAHAEQARLLDRALRITDPARAGRAAGAARARGTADTADTAGATRVADAVESASGTDGIDRAGAAGANGTADKAVDETANGPATQPAPTPTRGVLFHQAIQSATWGGETLRALDLIDRALSETNPAHAPGPTAFLLALRGLTLHNLLREGAVIAAEEALELVPDLAPPQRVPVLDLVSAVFMVSCHWERARDTGEQAVKLAAELDDPVLAANARITLAATLTRLGSLPDGLETLEAVREQTAGHGDVMRLARVQINLGISYAALGRHEDAVEAARAGLASARTAGLLRTLGALLTMVRAGSLSALGRWAEAEDAIVDALREDPVSGGAGVLHALRGEVALLRGDTAAARKQLSLARALLGDEPGPAVYSLPHFRVEAAVALAENRTADARRAVRAVLSLAGVPGNAPEAWPVLAVGAQVVGRGGGGEDRSAVSGGEAAKGDDLARAIRDLASQLPADAPTWSAHAAQCAAELGDGSWLDAVAAWEEVGEPYRLAYARMRSAEEAARSGDRSRVPDLLRSAAAGARELGARGLLGEIESMARAAHVALDTDPGTAPADTSPVARLGLTDREAEVLRLIAAGYSNRQIAEELFISAKTASVHVSRILGKLGVATRGEAAATAHRLRLFED